VTHGRERLLERFARELDGLGGVTVVEEGLGRVGLLSAQRELFGDTAPHALGRRLRSALGARERERLRDPLGQGQLGHAFLWSGLRLWTQGSGRDL
jgi:hypothetical protein